MYMMIIYGCQAARDGRLTPSDAAHKLRTQTVQLRERVGHLGSQHAHKSITPTAFGSFMRPSESAERKGRTLSRTVLHGCQFLIPPCPPARISNVTQREGPSRASSCTWGTRASIRRRGPTSGVRIKEHLAPILVRGT
jgi:hypothetical protein